MMRRAGVVLAALSVTMLLWGCGEEAKKKKEKPAPGKEGTTGATETSSGPTGPGGASAAQGSQDYTGPGGASAAQGSQGYSGPGGAGAARPERAFALPADWSWHEDPKGFRVALPRGWTAGVAAENGRTYIYAGSPVNDAFAVVYPSPPGGRSAGNVAGSLEQIFPTVFPRTTVQASQRTQGGTDAVTAAFACTRHGKPCRGRVLCVKRGRAGMLYAVCAREGTPAAQKAMLVQVLRSFSFTEGARGLVGLRGTAGRPAPAALEFVKFIDPKEKAFTLEVPKGWKVVEGGMFRASAIEPRTMVAVASPDGIEVVVGDKNLPTFALPGFSPMFPEGSWYSPGYGVKMLVKRYMSGGDFAEAYATAAMEGETTDLKFVKKRDLANEVAKINRIYQEFNSPLINTTMSLGDVAFTCHRNGVQTRGYCIAMTQLTRSQGMGNWIVKLLAGYSAPAAKDVQARAAMERMVKSFRFNDAWLRMQQGIAANVSQIVARTNDEISGIINDSYWRRQVVQEDVARRRSNAMLGQTDLVDPETGDTYKVRAGSNYYWGRPGDDTVVGTQTADRPDIDFHQMTEW